MSSETLNLFPARIPIGRVTLADGSRGDVLMTLEFSRALSDLLIRVGGPNGLGTEDLAQLVLQAMAPAADETARADIAALELTVDQSAQFATLQQRIESLAGVGDAVSSLALEIAELRKRTNDVEELATYRDPFRVEWERPGKIGALTVNSGAFTTLTAASGGFGIDAQATVQTRHATTTALGAISDCSYFLGTTGNNNETAQIGFGFANGAVVNAAAYIAYQITSNAGLQAGDIIFGTRSVTTDTAPTSIVFITRFGNVLIGTASGSASDDTVNKFQVTGSAKVTGAFVCTTGFGCNGQAAQTAAVSGGTLAGVISALVANGILSS